MIKVVFEIPACSYELKKIKFPAAPRVGDQIFLTDFITEKEEEQMIKNAGHIWLDGLIVTKVLWMRDETNKEIYLYITLEL